MEYKKILTGSSEFWNTNNHDLDYIIIKDQEQDFEYVREKNTCYFNYRKMTKEEFFNWQLNKNNWWMNISPLISREFNEYMNINIFEKDKYIVYEILQKAIKFAGYVNFDKLEKHIYKLYIYYCYIQHGNYHLTAKELNNALNLKNQIYDDIELLERLYKFFDAEKIFGEGKLKLIIFQRKQELEELQNWFTSYFNPQLIQASWKDNYIPSYDSIMQKQYSSFKEVKEQADINHARIKELTMMIRY